MSYSSFKCATWDRAEQTETTIKRLKHLYPQRRDYLEISISTSLHLHVEL